MKYYYISHEGPFRNNIVSGKDFDRINRDKNKIVITRINGDFHVLVCKNGIYEKEKLVLSYFELVNYLKRISFNAYFINVNSETAYFVNLYVKKDDEVNSKEVKSDNTEPFYIISDDKMLKIETGINREVVKDILNRVYERETKDEKKCHEISLKAFIQNEELFDLYHLPFKEKGGQFLIPNYSYASPKTFYILSGIYHKKGNVINLSNADLINLCMLGKIDKELVDEIVDNMEIKIVKEYELASINNAVNLLDTYNNENSNVRLKHLRDYLMEAKENKIITDNLEILKRPIEVKNVLTK